MKSLKQDNSGIYTSLYVVTVTYGNRYDYLKPMILACLKSGVQRVIVIDNNSAISSRNQMDQLASEFPNRIRIIHLPENVGSSGGYKKGLGYCQQDNRCDYIWMLDDDNCSQEKALEVICSYWNKISKAKKKEPTNSLALLSYRPDRTVYRKAIEADNPDLVHGMANNFVGFHASRLHIILRSKLNQNKIDKQLSIRSGRVAVAPYGGLFIHKDMLHLIGLPDETYFVYGDDYDFTHRITKNNGEIILLLDSVIEDLERSSHVKVTLLSSKITAAANPLQCYYLTRNTLRFNSRFVTNKFVFYSNMVIYIFLNLILVPLNFRRSALQNFIGFLKGTWHGLKWY